MRKIIGVGIDLISIDRIRGFLKKHRARSRKELLSPPELSRFKNRRISPPTWSRYFSAKEAYFKTLDLPWLGREGFQHIDIQPVSDDSFQACWLEKGRKKWAAEGCWGFAGNHVVAQVIRWNCEI